MRKPNKSLEDGIDVVEKMLAKRAWTIAELSAELHLSIPAVTRRIAGLGEKGVRLMTGQRRQGLRGPYATEYRIVL